MERLLSGKIEAAMQALGVDAVPFRWEKPDVSRGDLTTALPLALAARLSRSPLEIASQFAELIRDTRFSTEVSAPGYLNVRWRDEALLETLRSLLEEAEEPFEVSSRALFFEALSIDPVAAERESLEDPWYLIQYSFARLHSFERLLGEARSFPEVLGPVDPGARALLIALSRYRSDLAPTAMAHCVLDLAKAFQVFARNCRIISTEGNRGLREALVLATKRVLSNALRRFGISLPVRM